MLETLEPAFKVYLNLAKAKLRPLEAKPTSPIISTVKK